MARLFLLIDGYNVMLSGGSGRQEFGPGGLQRARNRFLLSLKNWLNSDTIADACVIFDARNLPLHAQFQQSSSDIPQGLPFKVLFAVDRDSADEEIEFRLRSHSSPRQVLVVSSDHRLHRAARMRDARCMDSDLFLELLESGSPKALKAVAAKRLSRKVGSVHIPSDKPPVLPDLAEQLADVHAEFEKIDVAALDRPRKSSERRRRPR